jgi:hypothetical protein
MAMEPKYFRGNTMLAYFKTIFRCSIYYMEPAGGIVQA